MSCLPPEADRVVRAAVEEYFAGRLHPESGGETVFETRHSKYRLMDGVLFSASDSSLIGAELVGWLVDAESDDPTVLPAWVEGARAVLVDRTRGRYIIVTSTARVLPEARDGSGELRYGSKATQLPTSDSVARRAGTLASEGSVSRKTPVPAPRPIPPCPPSPVHRQPTPKPFVPAEMRASSPPPAPSFGAPSSHAPPTIPDAPPPPRPLVHPPPRPIRRAPPPSPSSSGFARPPGTLPLPPPPGARSALPLPLPPPPPARALGSSHVARPRPSAPVGTPPPPVVVTGAHGEQLDDVDPTERHRRGALPFAPRTPAAPPSSPIPLAQRRLTP